MRDHGSGGGPLMASQDDAPPTLVLRPDAKTPAPTLSLDAPAGRAPASAFEPGWSEASRYALVSELARGGGGRIGVAVDRKLGRRVALKRPLDDDGNVRLERE